MYFTFNNFSENPAVYEIIWKNMVGPDSSQMAVRKSHALCVLDGYGYTNSQRVMFHSNNG
jgi:hypothetical protein